MAELKRALGFWPLLALAVGSIMGTGVFFGVGIGASYSGNASIISWVIISVVAIYISMFFGELVSMYPKAGGVYEFSKHAYNRFTSFMVAWLAWIIGNISTALLVIAAMDYLIPDQSYFAIKIVISLLIIIAMNTIVYFGIEGSTTILLVLVFIAVGTLLVIIFPGIFEMNFRNLRPLYTAGLSSIALTIFIISESFFGWESTTYLSEETKKPEKVIPKALIMGTVIVAVLSIAIAVISLGVIPAAALAQSATPLSDVSRRILGDFGMKAINIGIFISLIGAAASGLITLPRLILALARDKLFIPQFSAIHEKYHTPHKAIIFQTIISLAVFGMAFGRYRPLLLLLLPLGLILYFFIILAVFILRYKEPDLERPFKAPFGKVGAIVIAVFFLGLIFTWLFQEPNALSILKLDLSLISVGIPIYILLVLYYDPDAIIKVNDSLAYFTLWTEKFVLPKNIRQSMMSMMGSIKNKTILEFGCSVGTLTMVLAEAVKPYGKVYATDFSRKDLIITKQRLIRKGHHHVVVIHDEHQVNRVHPSIPRVDHIVSVGMMGYLQDVKKVLKEMAELLPYKGRILFMDYTDFFKIIPNVPWLSKDQVIKRLFREAGFSVSVTRKKGIFWNYVFVEGVKV